MRSKKTAALVGAHALIVALLRRDGYKVDVEVMLCKPRRWRYDVVVGKVAVEVHGACWRGGRHTRGGGFQKDREKMNAAQMEGYIVLEYSTHQIEAAPLKVLEEIKAAVGRVGA